MGNQDPIRPMLGYLMIGNESWGHAPGVTSTRGHLYWLAREKGLKSS